tara:strand:- start:875 stop:1090 length:216 start_codon:yes stop_codon:yes gene_type:complete
MSTISSCTKTTADSSWGADQIHKEIYINYYQHEDDNKTSVSESTSSCLGQFEDHTQFEGGYYNDNNQGFIQ